MRKFILALLLIAFISPVLAAQTVAFNTKTKKYHALSCRWAKACTVNCINIEKQEAITRGGMPCKVCGGFDLINFSLFPLDLNYRPDDNITIKLPYIIDLSLLYEE